MRGRKLYATCLQLINGCDAHFFIVSNIATTNTVTIETVINNFTIAVLVRIHLHSNTISKVRLHVHLTALFCRIEMAA
jgi:hypothetical protein